MPLEDDEATISFPSIAIVAVLGFFIYRYFFAGSANSSSTRNGGMLFAPAHVDQVAGMFPQLSRRDIMWDLQRNRGNVQATIERVLTGRGLEPAPLSFQPPLPAPPLTSASGSSSTSMANIRPVKIHPDLITRYNLQAKVNSKGKEKEEEQEPIGWASSKEQRQTMLQRRRDEMILAARRKMQEKDARNLQPSPAL